jgi:hypothetical protein
MSTGINQLNFITGIVCAWYRNFLIWITHDEHGGPEISQPPVFIMCDPDKEVAVPSAYNTGDKIKLINSCAHE